MTPARTDRRAAPWRKHDRKAKTPARPNPPQATSRRKFLTAATGAAAGAATLGFPMIAKAQRPDHDALAEHVAVEGHLPRVRARLREEGQRHDRRRPQDRGAAGGRGRAGVRPARRRVEGHARRRPRRARLPLRQAERAGAVGLRARRSAWTPTCCCRGTSTAAARNC